MNFVVDEANIEDLPALLDLYKYLHADDPVLEVDDVLQRHWMKIVSNSALRYVIMRAGDRLVSTCALTIIPNLTRGARPYGVIENVVTHLEFRKMGLGTQVLQHALKLAWLAGCYKVMLLTGSKQEATLRFYEKAGFVRGGKTAFIAKPVDTEL